MVFSRHFNQLIVQDLITAKLSIAVSSFAVALSILSSDPSYIALSLLRRIALLALVSMCACVQILCEMSFTEWKNQHGLIVGAFSAQCHLGWSAIGLLPPLHYALAN